MPEKPEINVCGARADANKTGGGGGGGSDVGR